MDCFSFVELSGKEPQTDNSYLEKKEGRVEEEGGGRELEIGVQARDGEKCR
jgi:hypothetical protein